MADNLFQIPAGYTLAEGPGENGGQAAVKLPAWFGDVASAPVVGIPTLRAMTAGEIIRVQVAAGQKVDVTCEHAQPDTQYSAVPFKNGKPTEDVMQHTTSIGNAISGTDHLDAAPAGGEEIVVRVNRGKGMMLVQLAHGK